MRVAGPMSEHLNWSQTFVASCLQKDVGNVTLNSQARHAAPSILQGAVSQPHQLPGCSLESTPGETTVSPAHFAPLGAPMGGLGKVCWGGGCVPCFACAYHQIL
jgi:hypothetical protein